MANCLSSTEGKFKIYNYFKPHDDVLDYPDFEAWANAIGDLTEEKMIVSWNHYTTPLKFLKGFGNVARSLTKKLSSNHGFFHKYLSFELRDVIDSEKPACAVSVEKISSGLLFQIAKTNEVVRDTCEGSVRQEVKMHECSKKQGFDGSLINNLTTMVKILETRERFDAYYNVLFNNCQQTVQGLHQALINESLNLKFFIPGTAETYVINDPKTVGVIEKMFPRWEKGHVQQFPDLPEPLAFKINVPMDEAMDENLRENYNVLLSKQRVVKGFVDVLESEKGRKAVVSNLTKSRYEQALALTGDVPRAIIEQISELWSVAYELVLTIESIGVVIVCFQEGDQETDHEKLLEMMDLASEIEKVPNDHCIHVVNIALGMEETKINPVKRQKLGYLVNVSLSEKTEQDPDNLGVALKNSLHSISNVLSSPTRSHTGFSRKFTAKLYILQDLVSDENLIHKRVDNQEFGPQGFIIWTSKQRAVLDAAKESFLQNKPFFQSINGCFGSGKTMVLMQMARDFVNLNSEGQVLILLHPKLKNLRELLQQQVDNSETLHRRVKIGSEVPSGSATLDIKLLLVDEFSFHLLDDINWKFDLVLFSILVGRFLLSQLPENISRTNTVKTIQQAFSNFGELPNEESEGLLNITSPFRLWGLLPNIIKQQLSNQPISDRVEVAKLVYDFAAEVLGKCPEFSMISPYLFGLDRSSYFEPHVTEICQSLQLLLSNPSIVLFSSYQLGGPNAESLLAGIPNYLLDGNLRSSTRIVKLIAKFQKTLQHKIKPKISINQSFSDEKLEVGQIRWHSPLKYMLHSALQSSVTLEMNCREPSIIGVCDVFPDRKMFIERCCNEIRKQSAFEEKTLVSCLVHPGMKEVIQRKIDEDDQMRNRVTFQNFSDILGCQYPRVVMILDLPSDFKTPEQITMIMSRATTSLCIIVNIGNTLPETKSFQSVYTVPTVPPTQHVVNEVGVCIQSVVTNFFAQFSENQ